MIKDLIKLANHLDSKGLRGEADYLDKVITKLSGYAYTEHPLGHPDAVFYIGEGEDPRKKGEEETRVDRPLKAEELMALMLADKGPGPYKLTEERLKELSYANLTDEECQIIGGCE